MEYQGKEKKPYRGIYIAFIVMIAVPIGLYFFFYAILNIKNNTPEMARYMSLTFAGAASILFDLLCAGYGFIGGMLIDLFKRIKNTLSLFKPFEKGSCSFYFNQFIHDGGPILWLFFIVFGATIGMMTYGLVNYLEGVKGLI